MESYTVTLTLPMDLWQSLTMEKYGLLVPDIKSKYLWLKEANSATNICELISKRMESINSSLKETGRNTDSCTDKCLITLFAWRKRGEGKKKPYRSKCGFILIIPSFFKKLLFQIDKQWWKLHFKLSCFNSRADASKVIWQLVPLKTMGGASLVSVSISE